MKFTTTISLITTAGLTAVASADITGAYVTRYSVTAADFDGSEITVNVEDLYLCSDDPADVVLNVYNFTFGKDASDTYFQSFTGTGWRPTNLGGPFDAPALRLADSFVTIGGFEQNTLIPEQSPGAGSGTGLDPNFGGNNAPCPADSAGWYNGSPPSLNGQVGQVAAPDGGFKLGVFIGRFTLNGDFTLVGSSLETTWNQGLGTPGVQAGFIVTPAPGALALFGLAAFGRHRRRA